MGLYNKIDIKRVRDRLKAGIGFSSEGISETEGLMKQSIAGTRARYNANAAQNAYELDQILTPDKVVKSYQKAIYDVSSDFKNSVAEEYKVASAEKSDMLYGPAPVAETNIAIDVESGVTGSKLGVSFAKELMHRLNISPTIAAAWAGNVYHESAGFTAAREKGSKENQGGRGHNMYTDMAVAEENRLTETQKQALSVDVLLEKGLRRSAFKKFSKENNFKIGSIEADLGFMEYEIKNTREGNILKDLEGVTDINEATKIISENFYRPNKKYAHVDRRQGHATTIFNALQKAAQGVK